MLDPSRLYSRGCEKGFLLGCSLWFCLDRAGTRRVIPAVRFPLTKDTPEGIAAGGT